MVKVNIDQDLFNHVPNFILGIITYHDITVSPMPQMVQGRFHYFQDEKMIDLENKDVASLAGVKAWRSAFKAAGTDPSRYRPSHEALIRRLKKGERLPDIHSAVDMNNYFSVKYECPMGIYDLDNLQGNVIIRIGNGQDSYEAISGRVMNMEKKLLSVDEAGAFGSPITDSSRTMTALSTRNGLHLIYFPPGTYDEEALEILNKMAEAMTHVHGGQAFCDVVHHAKKTSEEI